jgi:hypothetical protein
MAGIGAYGFSFAETLNVSKPGLAFGVAPALYAGMLARSWRRCGVVMSKD